MTTAQPLQIPFTEFHETGNFIHSQTTKLPKFQENTQNIWNSQKNDVPLRVNKQNSQKTSHMPTLTWIGKEKVVNHHLDVPFRVLDRQYTFGDTPDSGNKIIHGDNLEALKALLPEYEGKIKCIYIDPPYNTGNEKWVYNDNVNDPHIRKWLGQVVGSEMDDLTRHDKWLCMMYPRLVLLQRLLSEDGAIFISIDDNAQAYLKLICDEIFGKVNFVTQFVWQKRKGGGNDSKFIATDHEYIFVYAKRKDIQDKWRVSYDDEYLKRYKFEDEQGRYYYDTLSRPGLNNPIIYDVVCPDGTIIKDGTWQISKATFEEELQNGNVDFVKNKQGGFSVVRKVRMPLEGKVLRSILSDTSNKNAADEMGCIFGNKKEFSTPKPVELVKLLVDLMSNKDSIILDSFAGSGTTAHAVLNLNKQDGGNRKFILVELGDYAENITAERVRRVISGYGEGKNAVEGTGGSFDFYELGDTLFDPKTENLNDNANTEQIRQYVWYSETHAPYMAPTAEHHPYWLGTDQQTNYYFYYIKGEETCLSWDFLRTLTPERDKAEMYIIYADRCVLTESEMQQLNIRFKKIPRDIKRV